MHKYTAELKGMGMSLKINNAQVKIGELYFTKFMSCILYFIFVMSIADNISGGKTLYQRIPNDEQAWRGH